MTCSPWMSGLWGSQWHCFYHHYFWLLYQVGDVTEVTLSNRSEDHCGSSRRSLP